MTFNRSMLLIILLADFTLSGVTSGAPEFVIIIPSFNNEKYYEENLNSVCYQISTKPYRIIYVNDGSTDNTGPLVDAYIKEHHLENKVTVIHNTERLGSGIANIYNAIHTSVNDHEIVVIVDGDDWLPHNRVLSILETTYQNPDVWMTHGRLKYIPSGYVEGSPIPDWVYREGKIREKADWVCMLALRTFRAALFKKINKADLFYKDTFMTVSWDIAFCLPMIEMCAPKGAHDPNHYAFIKEVLYYYRIDTPFNDYRTKKKLQIEVEEYIRNLKPYAPLDQLIVSNA